MNKKILCFLLCLWLIFGSVLTVSAAEDSQTRLTISSVDEFLVFAENCRLDSYSQNLTVTLKTDIDLTGTGFCGIPIFGGTFIGNNHSISGLLLEADGSAQGLFRYLTETA